MSFEIAVQTVVYQKLTESAALMSLVNGVFDEVPEYTDAPYITIGESTHNQDDTDTSLGDNATITINTWSEGRGKKETKTIQGAIYDAMHRVSASYAGYDIIAIDWENSQSFMDQDGLTRHGVQTFRILIDKN